jgi:lipopolysaccharide export system ATP-binding protein
MLSTHEISKRYGPHRVVNGVSLTLKTGEIAGLLGPNGAGKTTCFYMIVGLVPCGKGSIMLDDTEITGLPMHIRARHGLGYLPQEASVFRKLSVAENILSVLEIRKGLNRRQRLDILDSLLHELHISHLYDQKAVSLSGGERRRVEIARALAVEPRFILLDEPFAGVDPISVLDIQQIIAHLRDRDIGVLITDHNVRETLGICDHAYILNEGKVIKEGSPDAILGDEQVRNVYLGSDFRM